MALQKNVASQKWRVFAFDKTTGNAKTGDAANITAKIAKDWAAAGATNDVNPTETEDGYYLFDLTQAETNADNLDLYPESATSNIQVIGVPGSMLTSPVSFPDDVVQTGDSYVRLGLPVDTDIATDIANVPDNVHEEPLEDHVTEGTAGYAQMLSVYAGPHGPGIYIDSDAANTNTVKGTDGTESNPVSTFVAARTLADGIGTDTYYLETGADLTLAAIHTNWRFFGLGSPSDTLINLGSQDVGMSKFDHVSLEGTQGGSARIFAEDCVLRDPGAGSTTLHILGLRCGIFDDITLDTSNDNILIDSYSMVAGAGAAIVRASGSAGTLIMNAHLGGVDLRDLSASHNLTINIAGGQVIFDASCNVNANVELRGIGVKTDNTAGMADLNEVAFINMDKINAEVDIGISDAALATAANLAIVDTVVDAILDDTGTSGVVIAPAQGPVTFTGVTNEAGLTVVGQGTGAGFKMTGGATGHGLETIGGSSSGDGINAVADGAGNGMDLMGVGGNAGLRTAGGATGPGIHAHGGATGATPGVEFHAHSATGDALELEVDGAGDTNADLVAILADTADMQPKLGTPVVTISDDIANQNDVSPAEVNAEMVDVMEVDIITLPGQVALPVTPTRTFALAYLYKFFRNRLTQNATENKLYADDETTVDQKAAVSDDTVTVDRGEMGSGP